jgi:hypothetical protein
MHSLANLDGPALRGMQPVVMEPEIKNPIVVRFHALREDDRIASLVLACEPALVVWLTWATREKPVYIDTVVGMRHEVDLDLPVRALEQVRQRHAKPNPDEIIHAYVEPIVALQDSDWEMPGNLELAYYAIYNLHRLVYEPQDTITPALILEQAIAGALAPSQCDEETVQGRIAAWWASWEKRN